MTVGELKKELEGVPEDREIRMFGDPEGNYVWGLYGVQGSSLWDFKHEEPIAESDVEQGFHGPDVSVEDFDNATLLIPNHT